MKKYLVVGLGNIGAEYEYTRHNIGFLVADALVKKYEGSWRLDRLAEVSEIKIKGRQVLVIKPTTYMNLSGRAFCYWQAKEKIAVENTLTIVDDIAIPLDRLRLRPSGSHAGHNGLKDIEAALGSQAYPRLRFGIGNHFSKGRQVEYVLGRWHDNEWPVVEKKIEASVRLIEEFVLQGIGPAMTGFNNLKFE